MNIARSTINYLATIPTMLLQRRFAIANYRPKQLRSKKSMKGFYNSHTGGSLRGTTCVHGEYGLQVIEGGRLKDSQLDTIRLSVRRHLKTEKTSLLHLNVFPYRPITAKGNGARMGKGKGAVDYFGTWVREGKVCMEISGARKETAMKALNVAAQMLPLRCRIIEKNPEMRVPPRNLPHFVQQKLMKLQFAKII